MGLPGWRRVACPLAVSRLREWVLALHFATKSSWTAEAALKGGRGVAELPEQHSFATEPLGDGSSPFVVEAAANASPTQPDVPAIEQSPPSVDPVVAPPTAAISSRDRAPADAVSLGDPADSDAAERQGELLSAIQHLQSTVEALGERSRADQDIIARMQARLEALQADQVRALLGPVVTELAGLHADFEEAAARDYDALGVARVRKEFLLLGGRVENALDLLGAVSVGAKPGQAFDSRLHTAARQTPTGDPARDKTIAAVLRQGFAFQHESKPALYARVNVYRYDSSLEAPALPVESTPSSPPIKAETAPAGPIDVVPQTTDDPPFRIPFESNKE